MEVYITGPYRFNLEVTRRQTSRCTIRVKDGILKISCPKLFPQYKIYELIDKNKERLYKMLDSERVKNEVHIFGKAYSINIIKDTLNDVIINGYFIDIHTKNTDDSYVSKIIHSFYKSILIPVVEELVKEAKYYYNPFPNIEYRKLKTMFGNYKKSTNTITLSSNLAKYDYVYIKMTLYHELTHTLVMDHSDKFYQEFEKVMPNCKKIQHNLRMLRYKDLF